MISGRRFLADNRSILHNGSYTKPVIRPEVYHSGYQKPPLPYRHHGDE